MLLPKLILSIIQWYEIKLITFCKIWNTTLVDQCSCHTILPCLYKPVTMMGFNLINPVESKVVATPGFVLLLTTLKTHKLDCLPKVDSKNPLIPSNYNQNWIQACLQKIQETQLTNHVTGKGVYDEMKTSYINQQPYKLTKFCM